MRRSLAALAPRVLPGNRSLEEHDPELCGILRDELQRQVKGLELIASENFTSRSVLQCLGSIATNKYAEGLVGARYYGGTEHVDRIERLCIDRALAAFRLDPKVWGVNVQPYSGSPANFEAYSAVLQPHDRLMGLDLPAGGHLTHGYYTSTRRVSATSVYFESMPYTTNAEGIVDYDGLRAQARVFRPKLIIAGGSAYPRDWDYKAYRSICDEVGAYLLVDMSHFSGFVATQEHNDPFEWADMVTTTSHKLLRGPRAGMIFFRREVKRAETVLLTDKVNNAVFPMLQGGPHMNQIAALATQLKEVLTPEFKDYCSQVKRNAKALGAAMMKDGLQLATGGSDNHLLLWNLRPHGITGLKMEKFLDLVHITANKNTIAGDKSAISPGGLRIGTPALTTRGFTEQDFERVAKYLKEALDMACTINAANPNSKAAQFVEDARKTKSVEVLAAEVEAFASTFPFPGFEDPFPV